MSIRDPLTSMVPYAVGVAKRDGVDRQQAPEGVNGIANTALPTASRTTSQPSSPSHSTTADRRVLPQCHRDRRGSAQTPGARLPELGFRRLGRLRCVIAASGGVAPRGFCGSSNPPDGGRLARYCLIMAGFILQLFADQRFSWKGKQGSEGRRAQFRHRNFGAYPSDARACQTN